MQKLSRKMKSGLTKRLSKLLKDEGIDIITVTAFKHARRESDKKVLSISIDGKDRQVAADEILLAAGKTPNILVIEPT